MVKSNMTLNKFWRNSGKVKSFKDFCTDFNASQKDNGFKNIVGDASTEDTYLIPTPAAQIQQAVILKQNTGVDKKQAVLFVCLGLAVGIAGVMIYKHSIK